jgi:hypothetical protein
VAVSKPNWTIRHARPEDGRPVRRFVFDILNEYHVAADPDDDDLDVMEFGAPSDARVVQLVAEVDGEPVGSAILTPYGEGEIKLSKLFLKPEFRGERAGWTRGPDQPPPGPDRLYYRDL